MRGFVQWLFADESRHAGREIWLIYGTRYEKHIYYRELFEQTAKQHPNFHYIVTLSRANESWQGARGDGQDQVRAILSTRSPEARTNMDAYICHLNNIPSPNRKYLHHNLACHNHSTFHDSNH